MQRSDYDGHGVWSQLKNVEDALNNFSEPHKGDNRYTDIVKKVSFLKWVLEKSEPSLFSNGELNALNSHLSQIINHIPNNANNWAHLPQIESFLAQAYLIASYPRIQKIFRTDANSFFEECEEKLNSIKAVGNSALAELKEVIEAEKSETSESVAKIKPTIDHINDRLQLAERALVNSTEKIEGQFDNWETRLNTEIKEKLGELVETFSVGQTARREEHEKLLKEIAEALRQAQANTDKTLSVNEKLVAEEKNRLEKSQSEYVSEANDLLAKINKIYGVAGNNALSGDFSKTAKWESIAYYTMTIFAAIFYIAIPASFAYLWINYIDVAEFSFSNLLSRLPISLVFLAPALYFGNLAQKHRHVSIAFRSLGLRIATFDSYLANFDDAAKNEEKKKMAEVFFDAKISADRNLKTSNKEIGKTLDQLMVPIEKMSKIFADKNS